MKITRKILAIISIIALTFSLTACGGGTKDSKAEGNNESVEDTSTSGSLLKVQIDAEVASMDPQIATDGISFEVLAAVTEGLYSLSDDGSAVEAIADKVEKSEDGLTYTVTLKDTKWSNGTPVTAKDFVFAWRRLVDPATASEYSFIAGIAGIKNADAIVNGEITPDQLGITAKDDKTLVIELDTPVPFFESLMAFPSFFPVNEEFYNKCGDKFATTVDTILCNGAFKVASYEPAATTINLEKNTNYWDADKVQLSGIQYQVIKDSQQTMLSYQNGDLDVATLSGEQVEQFQSDPEFKNIMSGYLWYIASNKKVAGLDNENLRKAISLSYDKEAIVNNILKDGSIKADFLVPTLLATGPDGKDFRDGTDTYLSTDKAKALEYYDKAKTELGKDSFEYTMLIDDAESAQNVAQFIQAEIQTNLPGMKINIETLPKKNRLERLRADDFELGLTRWGPDYADPMTYLDMWITGSPNNYGAWSNTEYDSLIQSAKKGELALDSEKRWEALKKAEKMVMDDAVICPVYQQGNAVMIKKMFRELNSTQLGLTEFIKIQLKIK